MDFLLQLIDYNQRLAQDYGANPAVFIALLTVSEIMFNIGLLLMLRGCGLGVSLRKLISGRRRERTRWFSVVRDNTRWTREVHIGFTLNRVAALLPSSYLLASGFFRLPVWVLVPVALEIASTVVLGELILLGFKGTHRQFVTRAAKSLFGRRILVRQAEENDIPGIIEVDHQQWSGDSHQLCEAELRTRMQAFPAGCNVAIRWSLRREEVVGMIFFHCIRYDKANPPATWSESTMSGTMGNHDLVEGNTIFGVGLTVSQRAAGQRISGKLAARAIACCLKYQKDGVALGSRIPRYHRFAASQTPQQYVARLRNGKRYDPELSLYESFGATIGVVLPGYFPDPESLDNGVQVFWNNPYLNSFLRTQAARVLVFLGVA